MGAPSRNTSTAEVVVAHDYFTQRGGAERVALELARQLDAERVVTAAFAPEQTFDHAARYPITQLDSRLVQRFSRDPRKALPFLARAWSSARPIDADAVVCSSSGWAHGVPVSGGTRKIVYCHNPARWLYQPHDYTRGMSFPVRTALAALTPRLRSWDHAAARSADAYVANSSGVARRIRKIYGIDATVVHPPISVDVAGVRHPIDGLDDGYFLSVGRQRGYKQTDVLIEAFRRLPGHRLVTVGAPGQHDLPSNIVMLGGVTEAQLRALYAGARALVSVSHEDFGLTPLEANAFGTPALVLRAGGFLDSTAEGVSGMFVESDTPESVVAAVRDFGDHWEQSALIDHADKFSTAAFGRRMRLIISEVDPNAHNVRMPATLTRGRAGA